MQDLDGMARHARELHDAASDSEDELVMDEAPSRIISTCSNLIQQCVAPPVVHSQSWSSNSQPRRLNGFCSV